MFFNVNYPPKTWTPLKTQNNETNCINSYFLFIFFLALIYKQKNKWKKSGEFFFKDIYIVSPLLQSTTTIWWSSFYYYNYI